MAIEVGVRELRNHTTQVVASIESGEQVYLTSHRRRIAVIVPLVDEGLAKLFAYLDDHAPYDSGLDVAVAKQRSDDADLERLPWS